MTIYVVERRETDINGDNIITITATKTDPRKWGNWGKYPDTKEFLVEVFDDGNEDIARDYVKGSYEDEGILENQETDETGEIFCYRLIAEV